MLKTNQLQALVAINANRITAMSGNVQQAKGAIKFAKFMSKLLEINLDEELELAYKHVYNVKKDIAKATELQKALKDELKASYEAQAVKAAVRKNVVKSINKDGQPKVNGPYKVFYSCDDENGLPTNRYFYNGVWYADSSKVNMCAFGNGDAESTEGERYILN